MIIQRVVQRSLILLCKRIEIGVRKKKNQFEIENENFLISHSKYISSKLSEVMIKSVVKFENPFTKQVMLLSNF